MRFLVLYFGMYAAEACSGAGRPARTRARAVTRMMDVEAPSQGTDQGLHRPTKECTGLTLALSPV
eukprot:3825403-Rhodomonas_salina.2